MFNSRVVMAGRVAHSVNNAMRSHFMEPYNVAWDELDEEAKHRALIGVAAVAENPDITPKECHLLWVKSMAERGYKYGENIDPVKMEHPAMVAYSQLADPQRLKTILFIAIVKSICCADK